MNKLSTCTFETPALYGDHHVLEVRRLLLELPGVQNVYASSAFQAVEVTYDPEAVSQQIIEGKLNEAGYLGEWVFPVEVGASTHLTPDAQQAFFRHSEVFEAANAAHSKQEVVSFSQNTGYSGRPLWNCPGFGVIKSKMED